MHSTKSLRAERRSGAGQSLSTDVSLLRAGSMPDFARLQEDLDYWFNDPETLRRALTRPVGRRAGGVNDDDVVSSLRLSWLGDAILRWVISEELWSTRPPASEADLTSWRDVLVDNKLLARKAEQLHLEEGMPIGDASRMNRQSRPGCSVWAGALEAIFGAILEDSDAQTTRVVILKVLRRDMERLRELVHEGKDPKSLLEHA